MGNCQAAESATVVIHHPPAAAAAVGRVERIYWSVSAEEVMKRNPGHYVALVVVSATMKTQNGSPMKQLKLLRPQDTLLIGHVYRLISFQDVVKEFAAKKCVKLGKLLKERGGLGGGESARKSLDRSMRRNEGLGFKSNENYHRNDRNSVKKESTEIRLGSNNNIPRRHYGTTTTAFRQWKPALQSIAELGTTSS